MRKRENEKIKSVKKKEIKEDLDGIEKNKDGMFGRMLEEEKDEV